MRTFATSSRLSFIVFCVAVLLLGVFAQGCDVFESESEPPLSDDFYAQVGQAYDEASGVTLESIRTGLRDPANHKSVQELARQGFARWAERNGADAQSFERGVAFAEKATQPRAKGRTNGASATASPTALTDSLLDASDLSEVQKRYIRKIPEVGNEASTMADLHESTRAFSEKVREQLGEKDSRPVIALASIATHQLGFLIKHADELAAIRREAASSASIAPGGTSHFAPLQRVFRLAQSVSANPPRPENYINLARAKQAFISGAINGFGAGATVGGGLGAAIGTSVGGGPLGAAIGTAIGSAVVGGAFGAVGGTFNAGAEAVAQIEEYKDAVGKWCNDAHNYSHPDYNDTCGD